MVEKTAVEWLATELIEVLQQGDKGFVYEKLKTVLLEQALKMEKQQIIDAFEQGDYTGRGFEDLTSEEYYHINFKSE
jgi:hypothetical protein